MVHKIEHLTDAAIRVAKSVGVLEMKTSSCYKLAFSLRIKSVCSFISFYNFKPLSRDARIGVSRI